MKPETPSRKRFDTRFIIARRNIEEDKYTNYNDFVTTKKKVSNICILFRLKNNISLILAILIRVANATASPHTASNRRYACSFTLNPRKNYNISFFFFLTYARNKQEKKCKILRAWGKTIFIDRGKRRASVTVATKIPHRRSKFMTKKKITSKQVWPSQPPYKLGSHVANFHTISQLQHRSCGNKKHSAGVVLNASAAKSQAISRALHVNQS